MLSEAIAKVWDRAEGNRIAEDTFRDLSTALDEESGKYLEEDGPIMPYGSIRAAMYALTAAFHDDSRAAEQAANAASGEVDAANAPEPAGLKEEQAWQKAWLQIVSNTDPREARKEFEHQEKTKPAWLIRWES
jgi:hypothetical protein